MSAEDRQALEHLQWFNENKMAFNKLQSQQPQTLAHALADSPVGPARRGTRSCFGDAVDPTSS